jgi:hypothetical protein
MTNQQFKYFAFISYNSKDTEWGKKVQKKLEHYRMPATLCSEHGWERKPISPIFFAPTDIQPGGLTEELQDRLRASRNLIVICSPNSAKSEWVGREIEFFHQLGRTKQIHFFIVEGTPHSGNPETECFNPIVNTLGMPEILGANIHEKIYRWPWMNKERAYVQLISKLLGVEFDAIWQRHKRLLIQKIITWAIVSIAVVASLIGVWITNQPVDVEMRLKEVSVHNDQLPPLQNAIITITLDNETKTDTLNNIDNSIVFTNIPHRFIGKEVRVTATCRDYLDVDTIITLSKDVILNISRNPSVFGDVHFRLWNPETEKPLANEVIEIAGQTATSDEDGRVSLFIPLEVQQAKYAITSSVPLANDTVYLPCGPDDVILTE